jgi:eukaryotic-like serine/threonine-protein kinase
MQDPSELPAGARVGDILADKYRIERILGVGGMGVVVAAYHIHLDERVAIKFLLPEAVGNPEVVARFAREAKAAVKIKSEHVARVIDVGTLASASPYMVMEYLEGCDLSALVQQRGALPIEQAIEFVLQACEAIADAHGLGIVHRDLKPANLFCIRRSDGLESIKVLDFGISKVKSAGGLATDPSMTRTTAVMGSPLYMSPEQMLSARDVDSRTDIWALGTILYELLTGRSPFNGETLPEVAARISSQPPPPIRALRPDVPPQLEAVILRCLEKDRNRRYSNVAELARELATFGPKRARSSVERISRIIQASGLSQSAVALPPSSGEATMVAGTGTNAAWGQTAPARKSRIVPKILGAILSLLVVGAAAVGLFATKKPPVAQSPPAGSTDRANVDVLATERVGQGPSSASSLSVTPAVAVASNAASATPSAVANAAPSSAASAAPMVGLVRNPPPRSRTLSAPPQPPASAHAPRPSTQKLDDVLGRQY